MSVLDTDTARQFRQQNVRSDSRNELYLVIDSPGTLGSHIDWQFLPAWKVYGQPMGLQVGFVGQLAGGEIIQLGMDGALPGGPADSFGLLVANDDDDKWSARAYVRQGATYTVPSDFTAVDPYTSAFITVTGISGTVDEFGLEVRYDGTKGSDNFHISTTPESVHSPAPGALVLALLGVTSVAGLRRRRSL